MSSQANPSAVSDGDDWSSSTHADVLRGILHIHVAFDWGEEIDLEKVRHLVPAETLALPRRRRTPTSFSYRPPPVRFAVSPLSLDLPGLGCVQPPAELTVFDFAAVSLAVDVQFELPPNRLLQLATFLADPAPLVKIARGALERLHQKLLPAIVNPYWQDDLSEEYFVFQLLPGEVHYTSSEFLRDRSAWAAGLVRLESEPLSPSEISEALRLNLSYRPDDLFVADWASGLLIDADCEETLQAVELANLQLLEYRHIDNRLDDSIAAAYRLIHPLTRSRLPFWRSHSLPLRRLGELKVEANGLFERTGNVLKLVGDPYLARVYRLIATRFHLEDWENSIKRKLEVTEGVYQVVSDQASSARTEFLEVIVILLIFLEIVLALVRH